MNDEDMLSAVKTGTGVVALPPSNANNTKVMTVEKFVKASDFRLQYRGDASLGISSRSPTGRASIHASIASYNL